MKKLYALCYGVILLCIVGTAILLIFTPDTIPVHYNFAGEVHRFGSKYENLIWPIFTISMGAFFILLAKQQRKKGGLLPRCSVHQKLPWQLRVTFLPSCIEFSLARRIASRSQQRGS